MKSPREILLRRHQVVEDRLNSIRQSVLAAECAEVRPAQSHSHVLSLPLRAIIRLWDELILPARRVWTGFAFVWLMIAVFNVAQSRSSDLMEAKSSPATPDLLMAWREQQQILADLGGGIESRHARKPKAFAPKPRSGRENMLPMG